MCTNLRNNHNRSIIYFLWYQLSGPVVINTIQGIELGCKHHSTGAIDCQIFN